MKSFIAIIKIISFFIVLIYADITYSQEVTEIEISSLPVTPLISPGSNFTEYTDTRFTINGSFILYEDRTSKLKGSAADLAFELTSKNFSAVIPALQLCALKGYNKQEYTPGENIEVDYTSLLIGIDMGINLLSGTDDSVLSLFFGFYFGISYYHSSWEENITVDEKDRIHAEVNFETNGFRTGLKYTKKFGIFKIIPSWQLISTTFSPHIGYGYADYRNEVYENQDTIQVTQNIAALDIEISHLIIGAKYNISSNNNTFIASIGFYF